MIANGLAFAAVLSVASCSSQKHPTKLAKLRDYDAPTTAKPELAQVPTWSSADLEFFLHGSMSTEVIPEASLRAFMIAYPDLFPKSDLSNLGLIPDPTFGWPIGFTRTNVARLGGVSAVGINCSSCHVAEIAGGHGNAPLRVLGVTSHFDAESFFGAVTVASFRSAAMTNMQKYLAAYLQISDPRAGEQGQRVFEAEWKKQEPKIASALAGNPSGSQGLAPGEFNQIAPEDVRLDLKALTNGVDLAALSASTLKQFHNMRTALHIPDQPPSQLPPSSGPGRNDAFGLLSAVLFGTIQPPAPVKYGLVWNVDQRRWVHWDGNTQSPIGRNVLAALGLGAPLVGKHGELDFALVKKQTDLSETIRPPHYPYAIDEAAAKRGEAHYNAQCASCHDGAESDKRLYALEEIGTQPQRAQGFTQTQADYFDKFLAEVEIVGYQPPGEPGIRSTQKYWAASLPGVWARSPYLHNGSVRTMADLLTPPAQRAKTYHRGSKTYDTSKMGYTDEGAYLFDTSVTANSNSGHDYGTGLSVSEKQELIEYLKTL